MASLHLLTKVLIQGRIQVMGGFPAAAGGLGDLADAAAFWTAQRDAVLREKESPETELAPAA